MSALEPILEQLSAAQRRVRERDEATREARTERDQLACAAERAGATQADLKKATGLQRAAVLRMLGRDPRYTRNGGQS